MSASWHDCRYLTCSVLPVRFACNCTCPFCFSKSSLSALRHDIVDWQQLDLDRYFGFACERGASRLVITGGGEPFLRADAVLGIVRRGKRYFEEVACFTNGSLFARATTHIGSRTPVFRISAFHDIILTTCSIAN